MGPLLLGMSKPVHVVTPSVTARGIVNISAIAATEAALAKDGAGAAHRSDVLARLQGG